MKKLLAFFRHVYTPHTMTLPEAVAALAAEISLSNSFVVQEIIWRHRNCPASRTFLITTFKGKEIVLQVSGCDLEELVNQSIREYPQAV